MSEISFWKATGLFGNGHLTYAPGRLWCAEEDRNPARMFEDLVGHDPERNLLDGRSESDFFAAVWRHAGWWDTPKCRCGDGAEYVRSDRGCNEFACRLCVELWGADGPPVTVRRL